MEPGGAVAAARARQLRKSADQGNPPGLRCIRETGTREDVRLANALKWKITKLFFTGVFLPVK